MNNVDIQSLYKVSVENKYEELRNDDDAGRKQLTRPDKLGTRVDSMPARIALFGKISVSARVKEPKQLFDFLKEAIENDKIEILLQVVRELRRPWMTHAILLLMVERRRCKATNEEWYRKLNRRIKQKCLISKKAWTNNTFEEIDDLAWRDQPRLCSKAK